MHHCTIFISLPISYLLSLSLSHCIWCDSNGMKYLLSFWNVSSLFFPQIFPPLSLFYFYYFLSYNRLSVWKNLKDITIPAIPSSDIGISTPSFFLSLSLSLLSIHPLFFISLFTPPNYSIVESVCTSRYVCDAYNLCIYLSHILYMYHSSV